MEEINHFRKKDNGIKVANKEDNKEESLEKAKVRIKVGHLNLTIE